MEIFINLSPAFLNHFETLEDPRLKSHRNLCHNLIDILVITILATICGADTWIEINEFGLAKYEWLKTFLELPNGIPSHDTLSRVFSLMILENWIKSLAIDVLREIIAIDGKTLRGSGKRRKHQKPLPLVRAWAAQNRLWGR